MSRYRNLANSTGRELIRLGTRMPLSGVKQRWDLLPIAKKGYAIKNLADALQTEAAKYELSACEKIKRKFRCTSGWRGVTLRPTCCRSEKIRGHCGVWFPPPNKSLVMLIEEMTVKQCHEFLIRMDFGRLACVRDNQPYVVPIYFAYEPNRLYGFSTLGRKIECAARRR